MGPKLNTWALRKESMSPVVQKYGRRSGIQGTCVCVLVLKMNDPEDRNVRWPLGTIVGHLPAHYQDFSTIDINATLGLGNSRKETKPHFMNKTGKALLGYNPELAGFCPTEEKQLWARGYQAKKKQEAFIIIWFFGFVFQFLVVLWFGDC